MISLRSNPSTPARRRPRRPAIIVGILATALVVVVVVVIAVTNSPAHPPSSTGQGPSPVGLYVSPQGSSDASCASSQPCNIASAVKRAASGETVYLTKGAYPAVRLDGKPHSSAVVITPADGVTGAYFAGLIDDDAPDVTWRGVTVRGANFKINNAADHTTLTRLHVVGTDGPDNGTVFVRADDVTIVDSLIEGGYQHDGIDIGAHAGGYATPDGAHVNENTTILRTVVRNLGDHSHTPAHVDCIQIYDTAKVLIEQSSIYDCDNGAIQTSKGASHGIWGLKLIGNFIRRCAEPSFTCRLGGAVADLRSKSPLHGLVMDHNTMIGGSLRFPSHGQNTISAAYNIVGYLSVGPGATCSTDLTNSLIANYDTKVCPGWNPYTRGNVQQPLPSFVSDTNLDLTKPVSGLPTDSTHDERARDGKDAVIVGAGTP